MTNGQFIDKEERIEKKQVLARIIIEMLGAPKEHIEQTLKLYIDTLKKNEKFEFVSTKFAPAEPQDKLFSAFADLEIWFPNTAELIGFCFDSLPSSVEILEPTSFKLMSSELSGLINDLQTKIHKMDMELKNTKANNMILNSQALKLIHAAVKITLKESPKPLADLASLTELKDDVLKKVLDRMVASKEILFDGNLYKLP